MKDHEKGKWVNTIAETAKKYGATQQLREHIHSDVLVLIDEVEQQAREERKEKDADIQYQSYVSGLWYLNKESAGDVSQIKIGSTVFKVLDD